jgi:hypothetical protein
MVTVEHIPFGTPIPQDDKAVFVVPDAQGFWSITTLAGVNAIGKSGRPFGGSQAQSETIAAAKLHCRRNGLAKILVLSPAHAQFLKTDQIGLTT